MHIWQITWFTFSQAVIIPVAQKISFISENLKEELDDYVSKTWPDGVVWILRLKERHGLIRTRMAGIKAASGDAIAVFDAHVEVAKGW